MARQKDLNGFWIFDCVWFEDNAPRTQERWCYWWETVTVARTRLLLIAKPLARRIHGRTGHPPKPSSARASPPGSQANRVPPHWPPLSADRSARAGVDSHSRSTDQIKPEIQRCIHGVIAASNRGSFLGYVPTIQTV